MAQILLLLNQSAIFEQWASAWKSAAETEKPVRLASSMTASSVARF